MPRRLNCELCETDETMPNRFPRESVEKWAARIEQIPTDDLNMMGCGYRDGVLDALQAMGVKWQPAEPRLDIQAYRRGHELGRVWAKTSATPQQLNRLAPRCDDWGFGKKYEFGCAAQHFYSIIEPECHKVRGAEIFWEEQLHDADDVRQILYTEEFVQGFAEGACEMWHQIQIGIA